jgi:hypothetical protein
MTRQDVADYLNLPSGTIKAAVDALESRGILRRDMTAGSIANHQSRGVIAALVNGDHLDKGTRQLADPDVAEADRRARVAVRLQLDRRPVVRLVVRLADVERLAVARSCSARGRRSGTP